MNKKCFLAILILILFILFMIFQNFENIYKTETFNNQTSNKNIESDADADADADTEFYANEISTSRLGNMLSCYFYNMGLAFLHGKNFQTNIEQSGDMFTNYFPNKVMLDKSIQDAFVSAGITHESLQTELEIIDGKCYSAWSVLSKQTETFWTIMKPIINRIYKNALEKSNLKKVIDAPVIHYRCSDSPINKIIYYHFQKYAFFKHGLDNIQKKTGKKYNKLYVCYCNSHYSSGNVCDTYSESFTKYLESLGYEVIIKCQSLNEDFASMFYAPALISTCSSLSFMAGYFSDGVFINSMYDEHKHRECDECGDWYLKGYSLKHSEVEDYQNTDEVISMLK